MSERLIPRGVIPAPILPFDSELRIDERAYRSHLRDVLAVEGISGVVITGVAQEAYALSIEEQKRVIDITLEEVGDKIWVAPATYCEGSKQAAALARQAEAAGAQALLIFPSYMFMIGAQDRPEMVLNHFRIIADATDLSMIVFLFPLSGQQGFLGYTTETLIQLAEEIPQVVAIKDACNNPAQSEKNIRALHSLGRPFSVLSTHSWWLMTSLVMGVDGLLSGSGSVIADLHVKLWNAIQKKDLATAQSFNDRIWPFAQVIYQPPFCDAHSRLKEALVLLGRQKNAYIRPPLLSCERDVPKLREALIAAGLLK